LASPDLPQSYARHSGSAQATVQESAWMPACWATDIFIARHTLRRLGFSLFRLYSIVFFPA
jgi:hypothetical protein